MLILLVVLGHIVGGMCYSISGEVNAILRCAYRFIYIFHMPAFFMIAGYLWKRKADVSIGNAVKHRIDRLVVPYFIWGILSAVVFIGMESIARMLADGSSWYYGERMFGFSWWRPFVSILHAGNWPNGEGFRCNSVLWFLPCMFVVLMVYDVLEMIRRKVRSGDARLRSRGTRDPTMRDHTRGGSAIAFNVCLIVVFVVLGAVMRFYAPKYLPWGLSRAPYMMIFFMAGRLLSMSTITEKLKISGWYCTVGWVAYGYLAWCYPDLVVGYISWRWYFYTVLLAMAGCMLSLCTAMIWKPKVLVGLGVASMGIMLTHKFFIMPVQLCYGRLASFGTIVVLLAAAVLLVTVSLISYGVTVAIRRFMPIMVGERR